METQHTDRSACLRRLVAATVPFARDHHHLTAQQITFFLTVSKHLALGESVNMVRIRQLYPELGRSVEKSYFAFLERTDRTPWGLAWLCQVSDPNDRRARYFELTPKGLEVVGDLVEGFRLA